MIARSFTFEMLLLEMMKEYPTAESTTASTPPLSFSYVFGASILYIRKEVRVVRR